MRKNTKNNMIARVIAIAAASMIATVSFPGTVYATEADAITAPQVGNGVEQVEMPAISIAEAIEVVSGSEDETAESEGVAAAAGEERPLLIR